MADEVKKSLKIEVEAEDKATANLQRISKRMLDDVAKLDRQIFNAGASAKQRELRDVDEHMAKLRQRYEGNAAMQAKIAEAAAAKQAEIQRKYADKAGGGAHGAPGLGGIVAPFLSMGVAVGALRVGIAAVNAGMADMALEAASATGSVNEMYEAWKRASDATKQMAAAVPFIGGALTTVMDLLGDTPGLEQVVKSFDKVRSDSEKLVSLAKAWGNELEIAAAKARGASEEELNRIGLGQKQAGRESAIKEAEDKLADARRKFNDAEYVRAQNERVARQEGARGANLGFTPWGQADALAARFRASRARDAESVAARAAQELGAEVAKQEKALAEARAAAAKLAEAEAATAREAAQKDAREKAIAADKAVTRALMSEEDKRLAAIGDHWTEVRQKIHEAGYDEETTAKKLTETYKAQLDERLRAREDFARQAAEKERQIQEQAANDIKDFMKEIEGQARERERKEAEATRQRQAKASAVEDLLRGAGMGKEADAMARKRRYDGLRETYASDPAMIDLINASERAERKRMGQTPAAERGGAAVVSQGQEVRFATRLMEENANPPWAKEMNAKADKTNELLTAIAERTGVKVEVVRLS